MFKVLASKVEKVAKVFGVSFGVLEGKDKSLQPDLRDDLVER